MVQGDARANRRRSSEANGDTIVPGENNANGGGVLASPEVSARQRALLSSMRGDASFCDAVLVVGGHEVPVHRAVLSQLSPFFKKILQQCAKAGSGNGVPRITLQQASVVSTGVLVDYAYGLDVAGSCRKSIDTALDVANLAATLTIAGLCDTAIAAAIECAQPADYPRVYYAFKLFGRISDADKVLQCMARDGALWKSTNAKSRDKGDISGIDRMAPGDLQKLVVSPELTASEDDLFVSLANWVSVDPAVRAGEFVSQFLPLIKPQRLTGRSTSHLLKLAGVANIPAAVLARLLAGCLAKPTAIPYGTDLGANVIVAKISGKCSDEENLDVLGCELDWLSGQGRTEFETCLEQPIPRVYPVATIHAQHYFLSVSDISTSGKDGVIRCCRDYYVDFISLCIHFKVEISESRFQLCVEIERRNKSHSNNNPSLDASLQPLAILAETTLAFLPGTPFVCAFGAWPARNLATCVPYTASAGLKKRQRTHGIGRMELVGSDERRKRIIETLQKGEEDGLSISVCLRTTKMSLLRNKGWLADKKKKVQANNAVIDL